MDFILYFQLDLLIHICRHEGNVSFSILYYWMTFRKFFNLEFDTSLLYLISRQQYTKHNEPIKVKRKFTVFFHWVGCFLSPKTRQPLGLVAFS